MPSGLSALYDDAPPESNALSERVAALTALASGEPCVILATPAAVLERTADPAEFRTSLVELMPDQDLDGDALLRQLVALGYESEEPVRRPGTFSRRGGILDVFAAGSDLPARVELFGDVIESLRLFDPESQRSVGQCARLACPPVRAVIPSPRPALLESAESQAKLLTPEVGERLVEAIEADLAALESGSSFDRMELYLPHLLSGPSCALDYAEGGIVFLEEPLELQATLERSLEDLQAALENRHLRGEMLRQDATDYAHSHERLASPKCLVSLEAMNAGVDWLKFDSRDELEITSLAPYRGRPESLAQALLNWRDNGVRALIGTDQPTRARQMLEGLDFRILADEIPSDSNAIGLIAGNLAGGFLWKPQNIALLTDAEVFGVGRLRLPQRRFREGAPIATVLDLKPGDFVVHIQFGIGVYRGLVTREVEGRQKEFLYIEYAPPDKLLVPTDQLDRLQKFLSPSDQPPAINRITGGEWQRAVKGAKKGAEEMARELIQIYAKRTQVSRPPFGEDSPWQGEMEATFPWVETPSQMKAVEEVKGDLDKPHPMDRLVCGDVGFGKTEVAVRAAFKVAQAGKQVAVLCPTTILADQHFETFRERLAPYPLHLHLLNRFRTPKQREATVRGLKDGSVDIVIGTHALLQKKVEFKNLGLVIVDEEQRFGVKHKEHLKALRAGADFLTLTATPIPRTLSMALMNIRQMSVITDPPPGRLSIRTYLRPYADDVVREALLRELARGGQVFYVFNRIEGIHHVAERISKLAPNARIAVGHGQMDAEELEPIMSAFFHGEIDVLVSTTIVENGIDCPNANTLIVDGADRLGLAQLYQLRGRVGRSDRQAYAYLLYRSGKQLTETAVARLKALQEFSDLGSGYSLAFRDLQIRGAGELLGAKQHGLMQTVGYELYSQLINDAVRQLKDAFDEGGETAARLTAVDLEAGPEFNPLPTFDLPAAAYLPNGYIEDQNQRLFFYKKLMEARDETAIAEVEAELADRYGPLPEEALAAAKLVRLRIFAQILGIEKITGRFGKMDVQFMKGRDMPLRVVHSLQRRQRDLKYRPDRAEWRYGNDALASAESFLELLQREIQEAAAARASRV
jgi:transcription-repair coupling factor (superfamily II helicase)